MFGKQLLLVAKFYVLKANRKNTSTIDEFEMFFHVQWFLESVGCSGASPTITTVVHCP